MKLINVHDKSKCTGTVCVIHNPTNHHMRSWKQIWRNDRGIFERICSHGVGHPDPDQFPRWEETNRMYEAVHGCDRCCQLGS
jgi:hypothetical protein